MWIPALRRFALLVVAVGGGTVVVSILLGLLLGASLPRSIALGYYLVGSFLLLAGFFFGNRGPVRPRGDADHGDFFMRPRGRRVRWATREEHEEAINSSALFVALGLRPDRARHALETLAPAELPSWVGRSLRLTGVRAFDRQWDVRVDDAHVTVEEA